MSESTRRNQSEGESDPKGSASLWQKEFQRYDTKTREAEVVNGIAWWFWMECQIGVSVIKAGTEGDMSHAVSSTIKAASCSSISAGGPDAGSSDTLDQCSALGKLSRRIKNTMGETTAVACPPIFCVNIHHLHCYRRLSGCIRDKMIWFCGCRVQIMLGGRVRGGADYSAKYGLF